MANASSHILRYVTAALLTMVAAGPVWGAGDCDPMPKAVGPITGAHPAAAPDAQSAPDVQLAASPKPPERLELGHWIAIGVKDLDKFLNELKCRSKSAIVYLDGHAMKGLSLSVGAIKDMLYFRLVRTSEDRDAWSDILGSPSFEPRPLTVTVGVDGEPPLSMAAGGPVPLELTVLTKVPAGAAGALFTGLVALFYILMRHTNILRDATPPEDAVAVVHGKFDLRKAVVNRGTYSLAKLQAAWWFFIIIGAYLLIGIVTWDFYNSVSSTALILLGIGAGTVVGGTLIDTSNNTPETEEATAKRTAELKSRILLLEDGVEYCRLYARQLDSLDPRSTYLIPLTPQEKVKLGALTSVRGDYTADWLKKGFGPTYTIVAEIFELQSLSAADEQQAAARATGTARADPDAKLRKLQQNHAGEIADLCHIKALYSAGQQIPDELRGKMATLPSFASLIPSVSEVSIEKRIAVSRYRKLTSQSEGWIRDIMSDANGVSFHRFQLFCWTLILGGVFVGATYIDLNMPVFDTTLMGLLGLSAATYLGLKIPEAVVPPR